MARSLPALTLVATAAAAALLIFTWIELASGWGEHPARLAAADTSRTRCSPGRRWPTTASRRGRCRGEAFSGLLQPAQPPLDLRDPRPRSRHRGRCCAACRRWSARRGSSRFVVVMIGTVTFDGLSQGALVEEPLRRRATASSPTRSACCSASRSSAGFYLARDGGSAAPSAAASTPRRSPARFVHSLVPIAAVYVAAHYLTFLIFEGQAIRYTAADPFGQGWDLFGWASAGINYGVLSQNAAWYLQVALVVLGHVAALVLAHDRALSLYGQAAVGGALPILDAGDHDRLHDAARCGCSRRRARHEASSPCSPARRSLLAGCGGDESADAVGAGEGAARRGSSTSPRSRRT